MDPVLMPPSPSLHEGNDTKGYFDWVVKEGWEFNAKQTAEIADISDTKHLKKSDLFSFIYVTGGMFKLNGTISMPKSVYRLMLDKDRLLFSSEMLLLQ